MKRIIFVALPALIALAGCSSAPGFTSWLTPYRIDIRQGNFVTQEMVSQLKLGQSREQVRFILGTALLTDPFHNDRWDYVYSFQPGRGEGQQRRLTVYFTDGKLSRIDGDVVAAAQTGSPLAKPASRVIEIGTTAASSSQSTTKPDADKSAPAKQ